jgi:N-methylhydantoinase A
MTSIAFDIGGTFTDFVVRADGAPRFLKLLTTPDDPSRAILEGVERLLSESGLSAEQVDTVLHATTVATNAILERKGSPTALLTTAGFRDVLIIGRQKRYETYDLHLDKPQPLVPRRHIIEVDERVDADGAMVTPLDERSVEEAVARLSRAGVESVAVCFLHAYANPAHEEAVAEILRRRLPGVEVSLSSSVSPKCREYERTSTTVANAYVKPIVRGYLRNLEGALARRGLRAKLLIMQSNGGVTSPSLAADHPIRIVESGPAAGVLMCAAIGHDEGIDHVLSFDMGGTTAKLGAVDGGEPAITATYEVDAVEYRRGSGLPLNVPSVDLLDIGAGGGSIASLEMGLIRVGPQSAGSVPGPICYGRGGRQPTVTDANLVLGYIDADNFNGGAMRLEVERAQEGIRRLIAAPLNLSVGEAAWGIHAVANSNMERAMRIVSVERGRDPREYALIAFGGAGPLHAARLARQMAIPTVIVPHGAGVGSAIGLLEADTKVDVSLTRPLVLEAGAWRRIVEVYDELQRRAERDLDRIGVTQAASYSRFAYMRYVGQGFEVKVDLPPGAIGPGYIDQVSISFRNTYEKNYGYGDAETPVEVVDWYLMATVPRPANSSRAINVAHGGAALGRRRRQAYFPEAGGYIGCDVVSRYAMRPDEIVSGPAIIEENETSTVILPDDRATISSQGHLVVRIGGHPREQ